MCVRACVSDSERKRDRERECIGFEMKFLMVQGIKNCTVQLSASLNIHK